MVNSCCQRARQISRSVSLPSDSGTLNSGLAIPAVEQVRASFSDSVWTFDPDRLRHDSGSQASAAYLASWSEISESVTPRTFATLSAVTRSYRATVPHMFFLTELVVEWE